MKRWIIGAVLAMFVAAYTTPTWAGDVVAGGGDKPKAEKKEKVKAAPAELVDITVTGKISKEEKQGKKGVEIKLVLTDQEGNKYALPTASKKSTVKAEDFVDKVVTVTGKGIKGAKGSVIKTIATIAEAAAAAEPKKEE